MAQQNQHPIMHSGNSLIWFRDEISMSKPQRVEKRANSLVLFSVLFFGGLTQRPGKVKGILIGGQVQKYLVDRVDVDVLGRHKLQVHAVNLRGHLQVAGHAGHGGDVLHLQALGSFTSKSRARPKMPRAFMLGDTARQMVPSDRLSSATTRLVVRGSRPRSTHSTEA